MAGRARGWCWAGWQVLYRLDSTLLQLVSLLYSYSPRPRPPRPRSADVRRVSCHEPAAVGGGRYWAYPRGRYSTVQCNAVLYGLYCLYNASVTYRTVQHRSQNLLLPAVVAVTDSAVLQGERCPR